MKQERVTKLEGEVDQQKQKIAELRQKIASQEQEVKDKERQKEEIRKEMREFEKQMDGLKTEIKKGILNIEERDKIIEQLRKEIADRDVKFNSLNE